MPLRTEIPTDRPPTFPLPLIFALNSSIAILVSNY